MFKINGGKGFQIKFDNGLTISVQFGEGNYCERYFKKDNIGRYECHESKNAEIAVFDVAGFVELGQFGVETCDDVAGYVSADEVAEIIYKVKSWKGK